MNFAAKIVSTLVNEIIEDIKMCKDIAVYHYQEQKNNRNLKRLQKKIKRKMKQAVTYDQWKDFATQHDNLPHNKNWKKKVQCKEYDYNYIQYLRNQLKAARENQNDKKIIHILRSNCFRDVANILNKKLYRKLFCSTKQLIQDFMDEVKYCIQYLIASKQLNHSQKAEFFLEQKHALGRTALILSGGGLFAMYSFGIIQIMIEQDLFPKIIAGSSAGSIVASLIGCQTKNELDKLLNNGGINFDAFIKQNINFFPLQLRRAKRLFREGVVLDIHQVETFVRDNIGDMTFQEAFDKTGRILNITVTGRSQHSQDRLLNYITAPYVVIWSAVACSCSIPFIYGPTDLKCKNQDGQIVDYMTNTKFVDGSIGSDLPMLKLAELFNATNFIVSQTNPFVVPFADKLDQIENSNFVYKGITKLFDTIKNVIINEIQHRLKQFGEFNLVPHYIQILFKLFDQRFTGNITIFPKPGFRDYLKILEVPSSDAQIAYFRQKGYEQVFDKIYQIKMQTYYERLIENGYKVLQKQYEQNPLQSNRISIQFDNQGQQLQFKVKNQDQEDSLNTIGTQNCESNDDIELLQEFRKKRKNSGTLRTGLSQIFGSIGQKSDYIEEPSGNKIDYSDNTCIENQIINLDLDEQQKNIKKSNVLQKNRNMSFTIPRSESKHFLETLQKYSDNKN